MVHLSFWAMSSPFVSPSAIPMFVCWGVSTALGVVIQYKITANNLNSGSSLLQFCNCCDRPKPDRWQDTSFFFLQVTMSSEDTSRSRAVHYSFDRTLQTPIHTVLTCNANHKILTHMHITNQPDADNRRDRCSSRATHTIHEPNLTFVKAWGWSCASRNVFVSRRQLLTSIVQYPSHVLLMTHDNKRTRNV